MILDCVAHVYNLKAMYQKKSYIRRY
jgi:hypothetical protein